MTSKSPYPLIGQSTPFGPAHSDSVMHPPQRRGLVESPRGGEGTTELTAARDSSHVKGKMEQHTGAAEFNILLATDSYKVSREPQPGPNRAGPGVLSNTGEPASERKMREREREMKVVSSFRPLTVESVSVRSVGRVCVRRNDRYIFICIPL